MKALVVQERGGPFVMEERPDPVAGPGEAVARILACGMGLTIQHTRMGRGQGVTFPLIIGHEIAAEIVEVGSSVDPEALRVGDVVTCYFLSHAAIASGVASIDLRCAQTSRATWGARSTEPTLNT
jgi:D-arabinose 1-dehydrogenase-like Zn-dependent alcohol dehydrogenase